MLCTSNFLLTLCLLSSPYPLLLPSCKQLHDSFVSHAHTPVLHSSLYFKTVLHATYLILERYASLGLSFSVPLPSFPLPRS